MPGRRRGFCRRNSDRGDRGRSAGSSFGQACYLPGMAKNTYGTRLFHADADGDEATESKKKPTADDDRVEDGREWSTPWKGASLFAGAVGAMAARRAQAVRHASGSSAAESVPDNGGVYLVPAFAGWARPLDAHARGAVLGSPRVNRQAISRALPWRGSRTRV